MGNPSLGNYSVTPAKTFRDRSLKYFRPASKSADFLSEPKMDLVLIGYICENFNAHTPPYKVITHYPTS